LTDSENLARTRFDKIRLQRNENFVPDRIERFVHDLRSYVELGNVKAIHDNLKKLIPEMVGPDFDEMMKNMFA
jgi:hypothetical protein